jgi:hypothetical protein
MSHVSRISGTIEALSPIHHGGDEKTGSTPVLRSLTHYDPIEARHVRLPFISGNALRGVLRRLVMRDLLDRLGMTEVGAALHHALFTGGILESTDDGGGQLDLAFRRGLRDLVPPIALFGTAAGNQLVPGILRVEHAMPVCREYRAYLPAPWGDDPRAQQSVRTFTDVSFATRRDDLRADREEDEQARQMKIDFECFIAGTLFVHGFTLHYATPVEASCLRHLLQVWALDPRIGGKSASGYGRLRLAYDESALPVADGYLQFLEAHRADIVAALEDLQSRVS